MCVVTACMCLSAGTKSEHFRKILQEAFWNNEVHAELIEIDVDFKFFKPEDREACMLEVYKVQRRSFYEHKCYSGCEERGKIIELGSYVYVVGIP